MTANEIGTAYDSITHLWERKDFDLDNGIEAHKRALAFTKSPGNALDVGCGCTGRFIALLVSAGFSPEGLDASAKMLQLAKIKHPKIRFHHADICDWDIPTNYQFISAWDSIWHVPLAQQEALMKKLFKALSPGGICIFSFGGVDQPGDHRDNTMGPEVYYASLGVTGFLNIIADSACTCRHLEYDQHPASHAYAIVQKNEAK